MSLVGTLTLGGGFLFPEESIGSFRSDTRRSFFSERYVSEILEGYWKREPS